jgi:hypothetical protein
MPRETGTAAPQPAWQVLYCRRQAEEVRRLAEVKRHLRPILLDVAEDYERLAEDLEQGRPLDHHAVLLPLD